MSGNHIPFDKLSDLHDGEIASEIEKASLVRHLGSCKGCALEYKRLEKTVGFCRDLAALSLSPESMPGQTLLMIKSSSRRKLFLKSLPAMAASILVIAGIGLFNTGIIGFRGNLADEGSRRSYNESEKVIEIIRGHKASIAQVTDEYVEGTVPLASFNELRKQLGSRKVAYMLVEDAGMDTGASWVNPIEKVGLDDGPVLSEVKPGGRDLSAGKRYVRFRVFR